MYFEIRDLLSEWETHVNPDKINVHPGETDILSILVNIPLDAEIGDISIIIFTMIGGENIHGNVVDQARIPYRILYIRVGEEPGANENNNNEEWYNQSWVTVYHLDTWGLMIHLFFIVFAQIIILYVIPELKKFKINRK